jgi:hypothetical protein
MFILTTAYPLRSLYHLGLSLPLPFRFFFTSSSIPSCLTTTAASLSLDTYPSPFALRPWAPRLGAPQPQPTMVIVFGQPRHLPRSLAIRRTFFLGSFWWFIHSPSSPLLPHPSSSPSSSLWFNNVPPRHPWPLSSLMVRGLVTILLYILMIMK